MADELVWRYLHPHAIKIQSWWRQRRPGLASQEDALRLSFDVAEVLADNGIPPIVTDLTSCLTSGDVLGVVDRERPAIIECKTGARKGRRDSRSAQQIRRYRRLSQHLLQGGTHEAETGIDRYVVEAAPRLSTREGFVGSCLLAKKRGLGLVVVPPNEAYLAIDPKAKASVETTIEEIDRHIPQGGLRLIATTFDMNDEPDPRWPPPSFWLTDLETASAVLENELLVTRFADLAELLAAAGAGARLVDSSIVVDREDIHLELHNAVGEVMNGFEGVSATAESIRSELAAAQKELDSGEVDRRRATWADAPVAHRELTISEFRATSDLPALLSGPLVVFGS